MPQRRIFTFAYTAACLAALLFLAGCNELDKPAPEPFFAQTNPPKKQELRWSNGKLPKSFDPALAAAPPETDVVRAIFEGLTETDPATLNEVPGVAESWSSTDDHKVWTFNLRKDAKWTNGRPVTADDFVRSWKRLIAMGKKAAFSGLLNNIAGVPAAATAASPTSGSELLFNASPTPLIPNMPLQQQLAQPPSNTNSTPGQPQRTAQANSNTQSIKPSEKKPEAEKLGIVAESDHILKVTLITPDKDFPKLVANPIFRPVYDDDSADEGDELDDSIITNGPFRIVSVDQNGVVLERSPFYWNREAIKLERVHFVPMESAEKALAAYREGDLDAVTNADFAPLVQKLLSPYDDFRRTTHSALNFYDINAAKPPYSDRRVRQALSNAIEREKLTEGEMDGVTRPALSYLPSGSKAKQNLTQDKDLAKELLEKAGYPDGAGFPVIRLLINRNDTQQRVARSVARMWKQNLNLDTEIIVKEPNEVETARKAGDFDLVRRGVVLPTSDEKANFMAIFDTLRATEAPEKETEKNANIRQPAQKAEKETAANEKLQGGELPTEPVPDLTEEDALYDLRAIPLYFPTSISLVRPYVTGFELNSLDALTLSNVAIDNDWQPKNAN